MQNDDVSIIFIDILWDDSNGCAFAGYLEYFNERPGQLLLLDQVSDLSISEIIITTSLCL